MASADFIHHFSPPADESAPVLLLLHGTGGNERDLLELGRGLAPRAGLLSPRGKVLENGMPRFLRRLAEGVFDEADLIARTHELAAFIGEAGGRYGMAGRRLIAVGYSNGANIAASLLLLNAAPLAGAVLLRAMVPLVPETPPTLDGVPVMIAAGENDPLIPAESTSRLAEMLRGAGADVAMQWSLGGHQLAAAELVAVRAWLDERFP
jgi:predicted esterase